MIVLPSAKSLATRSPMAEYVEFGTSRSSGTWGGLNTASVYWSGAPNLTVEWGGTGWSGGAATQVYNGTQGYGSNATTISRAVSGAGSKTIRCYSTDTSGRRIGKITQISLGFNNSSNATTPLTSVDVKNARELNSLRLTTTNVSETITSLDVSGMKKLTALYFNGVGTPSSYTTSINVTDCTALADLTVSSQSSITSITGLSSLKNNLQILILSNMGGFTSLDVSDFGSLYYLDLYACTALTSLRAQNVMLYTTYYYAYYGIAYSLVGGANLQYTDLSGEALNQFYTDLATETTANPAIIAIYGSLGALASDTSIATNKNYTVIGNVPP